MVQAAIEVEDGHVSAGLALLQQARSARQASGAGINSTYWSATLAEACMKSGKFGAAVRALADGFEFVTLHGERFWEPELYRLYGELLRVVPRSNEVHGLIREGVSSSDDAFIRALESARAIGSRSLELKAAVSVKRHGLKERSAELAT
jgi:hypothetical protein